MRRGMWLDTDFLAAAPGIQRDVVQACFKLAVPQAARNGVTLPGLGGAASVMICLDVCRAGEMVGVRKCCDWYGDLVTSICCMKLIKLL